MLRTVQECVNQLVLSASLPLLTDSPVAASKLVLFHSSPMLITTLVAVKSTVPITFRLVYSPMPITTLSPVCRSVLVLLPTSPIFLLELEFVYPTAPTTPLLVSSLTTSLVCACLYVLLLITTTLPTQLANV